MPGLAKCLKDGCKLEINPDVKNNGGTHCCRACKNKGVHGKFCKRVVFVESTETTAASTTAADSTITPATTA